MSRIVKVIEVLSRSDKSWKDAAQTAVSEAARSVRNIRSICVKNFEAAVENDKITQNRINAKSSFEIESAGQRA